MKIIETGADINIKNRFGQPPLYKAIKKGQKNIVEILLKRNVEVNTVDVFGNNALHIALQNTIVVQKIL